MLLTYILKKLLIQPQIVELNGIKHFNFLSSSSSHPNLIICDYYLPGTSGFEFFNLSKEIYPNTPFIFYTGSIDRSIAQETILAEAYAYIIKGSMENLQVSLAKIISKIILENRINSLLPVMK